VVDDGGQPNGCLRRSPGLLSLRLHRACAKGKGREYDGRGNWARSAFARPANVQCAHHCELLGHHRSELEAERRPVLTGPRACLLPSPTELTCPFAVCARPPEPGWQPRLAATPIETVSTGPSVRLHQSAISALLTSSRWNSCAACPGRTCTAGAAACYHSAASCNGPSPQGLGGDSRREDPHDLRPARHRARPRPARRHRDHARPVPRICRGDAPRRCRRPHRVR